MKIQLLGCHNTESKYTRYMTLLVDGILALDAGSLTSALSFRNQEKVRALLITHGHYDHMRNIPALGMNLYLRKKTTDIYLSQPAFEMLKTYLLNGNLYSDFLNKPANDATLKIHILEASQEKTIEGYRVLPVPMNHSLPVFGYQVVSEEGKSIFYTGDTGPGLSEAWKQISPQVLFIELTAHNEWEEGMKKTGHLTPNLLQQELENFKAIKGYLPRVIAVHMNPGGESQIKKEVAEIEKKTGIKIEIGKEGSIIEV